MTTHPGSRVQRLTSRLPVLHLEPSLPTDASWDVVVDGLVSSPARWSTTAIHQMVAEDRVWDLNCVWGWTRPSCVWTGVPAGRLIDAAEPAGAATHVMATGWGGGYQSCLSLGAARRSLLAWRLDGASLDPAHGGPLRLVTPTNKWGYKHVKWIARLTVREGFEAGMWEGLVGDAEGEVPPEILGHLDDRAGDGEAGNA